MIAEKNKNTKKNDIKKNKKSAQKKNNNSGVKKDKQRKKSKKAKYKVINWKEYNEALKQRGSLEFWMEEGMISGWYEKDNNNSKKKRKAGRKNIYSNKAILLTVQFGKVLNKGFAKLKGWQHRCLK